MSASNVLWVAMACVTFGMIMGYLYGKNYPVQYFTAAVILANMLVVIALGGLMWRSAA